jgi:hypothetical protein
MPPSGATRPAAGADLQLVSEGTIGLDPGTSNRYAEGHISPLEGPPMKRRPALLTIFILVALVAMPAMAVPVLARDAGRSAINAQHERAIAYWTANRIRSAVPRDFVRELDGTFRPKARPGAAGSVSGAAWPDGKGQIYRATGKVFFSMDGGNWVCSGAVATDGNTSNGRSIVQTAGHCAFDESAGEFATNWVFIPQYDGLSGSPYGTTSICPSTPYGCWTATALVVHNGYATAGGFNEQATRHDFAYAAVGTGSKGTQLDAAVGTYQITTAGSKGERRYAFGYPAAGKYKGNNLTYCAGNIFEDPYNDQQTWGMTCDMTGGSSGGPWLRAFDESTGIGALSSLNSYGYSGVRAMHGPKFSQDTLDVYNAAKSVGANTTVN